MSTLTSKQNYSNNDNSVKVKLRGFFGFISTAELEERLEEQFDKEAVKAMKNLDVSRRIRVNVEDLLTI